MANCSTAPFALPYNVFFPHKVNREEQIKQSPFIQKNVRVGFNGDYRPHFPFFFLKKWSNPSLFFVFSVFLRKHWYNFCNKLMWRNVHPVHCARNRTHNLTSPITTRPGLPPIVRSFCSLKNLTSPESLSLSLYYSSYFIEAQKYWLFNFVKEGSVSNCNGFIVCQNERTL